MLQNVPKITARTSENVLLQRWLPNKVFLQQWPVQQYIKCNIAWNTNAYIPQIMVSVYVSINIKL